MTPAQRIVKRRRLAMEQSLLNQWASLPQANTVLERRRAAGILGLGGLGQFDEAALAAKQKELADLRAERQAIEAETARLKGSPFRSGLKIGVKKQVVVQQAAQAQAQAKAPVVLRPQGLNWKYLLIGGVGLALLLKKKR